MINDSICNLTSCTVSTSRCYDFFTWQLVNLVWNPVSDCLDTRFVKGFKSITKIFFRTIFIVLTHGKIITICKGITILDNWVKEGTVIGRYKLWCHFKWCYAPWFEQINIFSNLTVSIDWRIWTIRDSLEVWESFVDQLWIISFSRFKSQLSFFFSFCWRRYSNILIIWSSNWNPNCYETRHIKCFITLNVIRTESQDTVAVCFFHVTCCDCICIRCKVLDTISCTNNQSTVFLVGMDFTHFNIKFSWLIQSQFWIVSYKRHLTRCTAVFRTFCIISCHDVFTITYWSIDFICTVKFNIWIVHLTISWQPVWTLGLSTRYILDTTLHQVNDGIVIWRLSFHVVTIICIKVSIVDTSDCFHVLQHNSVGCWDVIQGIFFVAAEHVFVINLKGFLHFSISDCETIWFWIDFFLDDFSNNILNVIIMGTDKDVVSWRISVFLVVFTDCRLLNCSVFVIGLASIFVNPISLNITLCRVESIVVQRTYSWCTFFDWFSQWEEESQTLFVFHGKRSTICLVIVVVVIKTPCFKDWDVGKSVCFRFVNTIVLTEVVCVELKHVCIDIIYRVDTDTIEVSILVTHNDWTPVHKVVDLVQLFRLNNWVWQIYVIS